MTIKGEWTFKDVSPRASGLIYYVFILGTSIGSVSVTQSDPDDVSATSVANVIVLKSASVIHFP